MAAQRLRKRCAPPAVAHTGWRPGAGPPCLCRRFRMRRLWLGVQRHVARVAAALLRRVLACPQSGSGGLLRTGLAALLVGGKRREQVLSEDCAVGAEELSRQPCLRASAGEIKAVSLF